MSERESRYTNGEATFDELAKGLAVGVSRRKALRLMGAALVGGALASLPGAAWAKKCKPLSQKCATNSQCCSRNCIKNPQGNGRICGCPTSQTLCDNRCVVCNNTGEVVNPTTCQCECLTGEVVCNGACVSNSCGANEVFDPTTCRCEAADVCTANQSCGTCIDYLEGSDDPFPATCRCYARADGNGNYCASSSTAVESCAECAVIDEQRGFGTTVCIEYRTGTGETGLACALPCFAEDGTTCGHVREPPTGEVR